MSGHRRVVSLRLVASLGAGLVATLCLVAHAAGPAELTGLLFLLPPLLLGLALFGGRYPGERTLGRLRRSDGIATRRCSGGFAVPRRDRASILRGGLLIASGLAGRAPPVAGCR